MPQKSEYRVIEAPHAAQLQALLVPLGMEGWRPILLSSAAAPTGVITTVILEHVLGS
jgi:hypothetical protein